MNGGVRGSVMDGRVQAGGCSGDTDHAHTGRRTNQTGLLSLISEGFVRGRYMFLWPTLVTALRLQGLTTDPSAESPVSFQSSSGKPLKSQREEDQEVRQTKQTLWLLYNI